MYGMIHKAVRDLVQTSFGEDTWTRIQASAALEDDHFLSLRNYDDELAYRLVGAASEELDMDANQLLEEFGKHWVLVTLADQYDQMLKSYGKNALDLLGNLNLMHTHIRSTFLHYKPPHFEVEAVSDEIIRFHYQSVRQGMTPFVTGLLHGIGELYGEQIDILSLEHMPVEAGEHAVFTLRRS